MLKFDKITPGFQGANFSKAAQITTNNYHDKKLTGQLGNPLIFPRTARIGSDTPARDSLRAHTTNYIPMVSTE